jgi:hypothetical protein
LKRALLKVGYATASPIRASPRRGCGSDPSTLPSHQGLIASVFSYGAVFPEGFSRQKTIHLSQHDQMLRADAACAPVGCWIIVGNVCAILIALVLL